MSLALQGSRTARYPEPLVPTPFTPSSFFLRKRKQTYTYANPTTTKPRQIGSPFTLGRPCRSLRGLEL
jgi:hypothetical protein